MTTTYEDARKAARRAGYFVIKSRRRLPPEQGGGYMLIDEHTRSCVAGSYFNLTADDVVELCRERYRDQPPSLNPFFPARH